VGEGVRRARGPGQQIKGERSDRRLARGSATRDAIVRSAGELLRDGNPQPTSRQVAHRTGVSRRLVFYYFPRVDTLVGRAVESQLARQRSLTAPLPSNGPADIRIHAVCRQRRELFEQLGPVYGAATALAARGGTRERDRPVHLAELRHQLAETFAPEIARHGRDGPIVLNWLDFVTGWEHWHFLRSREGMTPRAAERSVAALVRHTLTRS
jgi:AcrR family transcriptional regulator